MDSYKSGGWYAKLLGAGDTLRRFDECYDATVAAFVADDSLRSNLSDEEVEIVYQHVARRLIIVATFAKDSTAAVHDIARESERLQEVARKINSLMGHLDGFTRVSVVKIMVALLSM
jgi:hypothetical protein